MQYRQWSAARGGGCQFRWTAVANAVNARRLSPPPSPIRDSPAASFGSAIASGSTWQQKMCPKRKFILVIFAKPRYEIHMQQAHPNSLPAQAGAIAVAIRADADQRAKHGGAVALLHALILGALARIFARLGDMIALWQAGLLPLTCAAPSPPRRAPHAVVTSSASGQAAPRRALPRATQSATPHPFPAPKAPARHRARVAAIARGVGNARPRRAGVPPQSGASRNRVSSVATRAIHAPFSIFAVPASLPNCILNVAIS